VVDVAFVRGGAHLRAIKESNLVSAPEVVIKRTQPMRVVEGRGVAAGLGPEYIGRVFLQLSPVLLSHLQRAGAQPGTLVHYYDKPRDDGTAGVHVAYEIGEQTVPAGDGIQITELPVVEVASVVHRGGMEDVTRTYEALLRWIGDSGFQHAGYSRELYHEMGPDGPRLTEIQVPIVK
jgi:effector-binding domain-containing protein